jgi:integrase/recombinase XerD
LSRLTQGDYRFSQKIDGTKKRIKELMSKEEYAILEKYEIAMVKSSLADGTKAKNFDEILGLTRMLKGNWLDVNQDDIDSLVVSIMNRYSDNGKETNSTSDKKRFLKIWFRFVRLGSRSFKKVGDPVETHGLEIKSIDPKITRMQLITPEEKKRLLDACTNLRDKCLIDVHYDAGTRIGEILSVQIKHVKNDRHGYTIAVDGKTGSRPIRILESSTSLARWLESHPNRDDPEAWLFPSMKTIWAGSKLSYPASVRVLDSVTKRAKMRHLNWHLFRHTEATRTAKYMTDGITKMRHGWSATSKMPSRYAHIVNQDVDDCFLKHHGITPENKEELNIKPISCPVCKAPNSHDTTMCQVCGKPLSIDKAILLETEAQQRNDDLEERLSKMELLLTQQVKEHVQSSDGQKGLEDHMRKR